MKSAKEKENGQTLGFCRELYGHSMKLFITNLFGEGVSKDQLARALKKTEPELGAIIAAIHEKCMCRRHEEEKRSTYATMRKDYLTRILVYYLKERDSVAKAVYFPRQSFKIFAEAVRKLLGDNIIEDKQIQCYAIVKDHQNNDGRIDWKDVYVDVRAKQISWDILSRISMAMQGLSGDWFKEYIAEYAKKHGGFYGEGMAHYVQERLESIAETFRMER